MTIPLEYRAVALAFVILAAAPFIDMPDALSTFLAMNETHATCSAEGCLE